MRLAAFLTTTLLPLSAMAQDAITLDPVFIQGGLTPISAHSYGRAATVLTGDEMRERGLTRVQDALRALPGVAITGAGASHTQIRLRGAEGNHTLVLIDGVRAAGGTGEYYLSGLDTTMIERIEVLRGPQSVFFGADAMGGVINIVTRKAEAGSQARLSVEAGNGAAASALVSTRGARGGLAMGLSTRNDHGYDYSGTPGGEKDGIERTELTLSGDIALTETASAGFSLRRADEHFGWDATAWPAATAADYVVDSGNYTDRTETGGQIWAQDTALDGRLSHRLSFDSTRTQTQGSTSPADARTRAYKYRAVYGLTGDAADAAQTLAFGLERRLDDNTLKPAETRRANSAIVEYRGAFGALDVQAGLRHDRNNTFGNATTGSVGLSYTLADQGLRLHASAGTATVNPEFIELYDSPWTTGNPDLMREDSRGVDLGIEATLAGGRGIVDVTLFAEDLENEITYDGTKANGTNYGNQSGTSTRRGVEIDGRWHATDDLTIAATYTWLRAKEHDGRVETGRPEHMLGITAQYAFDGGRGTVSGDLRHVAGNWDDEYFGAYRRAELPGYTVVNVAAGYDLTDRVRVTGRVVNLFDKTYSDVWGYATQGRTGWVGIESRW